MSDIEGSRHLRFDKSRTVPPTSFIPLQEVPILVPCFKAHVKKSVCLIQHQDIQASHTASQVQTLSLSPEHVLQAARGCHNDVPTLERKLSFTVCSGSQEQFLRHQVPTLQVHLHARRMMAARETQRGLRERRIWLQARTRARQTRSSPLVTLATCVSKHVAGTQPHSLPLL